MKIEDSHQLISKIESKNDLFNSLNLRDVIKKYKLNKYGEILNFSHNDKYINNIVKLLSDLESYNRIDSTNIINYVKSLLSHKTHYGFLSELLSLSYLHRNNVEFDVEIFIKSERIYSKNNVTLDGYINSINTYFDVKAFGIQSYAKRAFARELEKEFPNHSVLIDGCYDVSYKDIEKYAFSNINSIKNNIKETGLSKIEELNWDIRISNEKVRTSTGSSSPYREASNNKLFIFRKCSQFTIDAPFILICTFDNQSNNDLVVNFSGRTDIMTRALARRAFIEFKDSQVQANTIDSKCREDITLSQASRALSGILFIDAYNDKAWMYLNPNARNKLNHHQLLRTFDFHLPHEMYFDDFLDDNY